LEHITGRLRSNKNTAIVGPAGLGKTAVAAKALTAVVGDTPTSLADSPFPDGVVFLDLYAFHGEAGPSWDTLANKLAGAGFMERSPARARATDACRARRVLIVIEGGEEADGKDGRADIGELLIVLSPQNRWLLLTRLSTQAAAAESVVLSEALHREDAARMLDALTRGRVATALRDRALELLAGHPLALTWAGNLLARGDDDPERLVGDWEAAALPRLSDPRLARRTLEWLFNRSVRGLDDTARQVLAAAALLARAPFPLAAIVAVLRDSGHFNEQVGREALRSLVQSSLLRRSEEADHWQFAHVLSYRFARKETGSDPAIRMRLGRWLHDHLAAALATGAAGDGPLSLSLALEHLTALLRADDDQRLWSPLAKSALYDFADRLADVGRLTLVKLALGAVASWLERFPADKAQEPDWLREHSVLVDRQGNVLMDQGDLAGALGAYGKSLEVRRRLAEADPSNAGWQRDLSVSHEKNGDVLRDQGDLAGALAAYGKSLEVSRRLAEADPSNAGWQRDLAFVLTRMAVSHERHGDRTEALRLGEESLMIGERLAALDRSNATWQQDVAFSRALATRLRD
jgi:tetratricopeptide (TPR) repeat protein